LVASSTLSGRVVSGLQRMKQIRRLETVTGFGIAGPAGNPQFLMTRTVWKGLDHRACILIR
jgi:hypothetical protein